MNELSIQEEVLGRLTWDPEFGWWAGAIELFPGHLVNIAVSPEDADLATALKAARRAWDEIREEEIDLRRSAADELLDLHNQEWNDGLPIDAEEFSERMTLESITFFPDGGADLFYHDGGLFGGNTIILGVLADGSFGGATIAG